MDNNMIKGTIIIEDSCKCWESSTSQLYKYHYQLMVKKGEKVDLKGHLFGGEFVILDIISNDEIIISLDNQEPQSLKRGETKTLESSDSCGEGQHFEAYRSDLTVTFVDE